MTKTVFIDGGAGTTGLEIADRLAGRPDLSILTCPMIAARTPGRGARRSTTPTSSFSACPTMRRAKRCR
ncbi:N-acetyl-gamma-glutamyl-phosphate reductase [Sphingomonas paucimobilis]|nr:N-acetyl-gamma-glutamyl-phosphate reductase [Sphingomonas paucimobilis]